MSELSNEALVVIEKVKKLLALASGNANEHEASSASAKAMELLSAYNLDMAAIGKTAKGSQRNDSKLKGGLYGWQRSLWKAVAELNFCMYWSIKGQQRGSTYEHRVLGSQVNVISARNMAEYLQTTVERLTREYNDIAGYHSIFVRELIAYREGLSTRLVERLQQIRAERLAEDKRKEAEQKARQSHPSYASSGTGIVLASVIQSEEDLNTDYLHGLEPGTTASRRAEQAARQAAANAAYEKQMADKKAWREANPTLAAEEDARTAKANAEWWDNYYKKHGKPRERALTAAEQRSQLSTFGHGYSKGADVGLDDQISRNKAKGIK